MLIEALKTQNMIAVNKYIIIVFGVPKVYYILEHNIMVETKLPNQWRKSACKTAAVISLQTSPFLTFYGWFAPNNINV